MRECDELPSFVFICIILKKPFKHLWSLGGKRTFTISKVFGGPVCKANRKGTFCSAILLERQTFGRFRFGDGFPYLV